MDGLRRVDARSGGARRLGHAEGCESAMPVTAVDAQL